mmetsp:Transcript_65810/g.148478  ORF Transcript_65810/g.148478 Transcript_65810/m.148478 type:complete len:341 (+) Transcript_65810:1464-2486(+)
MLLGGVEDVADLEVHLPVRGQVVQLLEAQGRLRAVRVPLQEPPRRLVEERGKQQLEAAQHRDHRAHEAPAVGGGEREGDEVRRQDAAHERHLGAGAEEAPHRRGRQLAHVDGDQNRGHPGSEAEDDSREAQDLDVRGEGHRQPADQEGVGAHEHGLLPTQRVRDPAGHHGPQRSPDGEAADGDGPLSSAVAREDHLAHRVQTRRVVAVQKLCDEGEPHCDGERRGDAIGLSHELLELARGLQDQARPLTVGAEVGKLGLRDAEERLQVRLGHRSYGEVLLAAETGTVHGDEGRRVVDLRAHRLNEALLFARPLLPELVRDLHRIRSIHGETVRSRRYLVP